MIVSDDIIRHNRNNESFNSEQRLKIRRELEKRQTDRLNKADQNRKVRRSAS